MIVDCSVVQIFIKSGQWAPLNQPVRFDLDWKRRNFPNHNDFDLYGGITFGLRAQCINCCWYEGFLPTAGRA